MIDLKCITAEGRPGRLVAARLKPGQDVVESLYEIIQAYQIRSGTVRAIGSLRSATVVYPNTMEFSDDPMEAAVFHKIEGPVELGMGYGVFGRNQDGSIAMHIHGLVMDKDGDLRTGNLLPGSAPVLATVELTIQEFLGMELEPTYDPEWKFSFLHPTAS
jgi:hypothetical protein